MAIEAGVPAPDFALQDSEGNTVRLADYRGRKVVLYFYPKDDTPGCTTEACSFRDNLGRVQALGAVVLGVSPDTVESHRKFAEKHGLQFTLLADPEATTAQAYGVWVKKTMYGRAHTGIERTTFIIDEQGIIRRVFPKVKVEGHTDEVIEALKEMG
jgi:peroxiredoxin Q/BCP